MTTQFDVIVIGSGFGGSVAAYEFADAGRRVCVLERGRKYPPGSFARSPYEMSRNFWDPSRGYYGLFDIWSFRKSEAIVSSGLGGGSLIYANVLLRKPANWFEDLAPDGSRRPWPISREQLDEHYDAVESVLGGTPYPIQHEPYASTPKVMAFRQAAAAAGLAWEPLSLAVTFSADGTRAPRPGDEIVGSAANLHGAPRGTCRLCGECDVGCNYGSKNTLDFNYLSMAEDRGADVRPLHEVREIRPIASGGFEVEYVAHDPNRWEGRPRNTHDLSDVEHGVLRAKHVILAAGALGSTYLLLKNRRHLPGLSRALGSRYSTNGDLLTFAMRCTDRNGRPRFIDPSRGPVITGMVSSMEGSDRNPAYGGFLQDAGYPQFVNWAAESAQLGGWLSRGLRFAFNRLLEWLSDRPQSDIDADLSRLLGQCTLTAGSVPLLGMGRDEASGSMSLSKDRRGREFLDIDWSGADSKACFAQLTELSSRIAKGMNGSFHENPLTRWLHRYVTVHPLGGCPMGTSIENGVVDSFGEVFRHPGLFVLDGAAMPGSVGSNPSLTIAAFARRCCLKVIHGESQ